VGTLKNDAVVKMSRVPITGKQESSAIEYLIPTNDIIVLDLYVNLI